ncbi:hypothetical protein DVA86_06065 [Streptomyces armeniacus]|uniref:Uncharacterized protein n=1 Tax=Streptomyces armeniacus TaxID=83291 RepID=A0A345XZQ4_9ACTN|nr:hypothetical protein [Streptomyces armeniacus]AXK37120.1 hypothetical protein DVA86_06065 [Streptomyces armeniacus]
MPDDTPLTRTSFRKLSPILAPRPLPELPERRWTDDEWDRIRHGVRARGMDDRWHVFAEGEVVHVHRSWTGNGIYEVRFAPAEGGEGGWRIASAVVETDPQRYRSRGGEFERVTLELVLSTAVLGEPARELAARQKELLALPAEGLPEQE